MPLIQDDCKKLTLVCLSKSSPWANSATTVILYDESIKEDPKKNFFFKS